MTNVVWLANIFIIFAPRTKWLLFFVAFINKFNGFFKTAKLRKVKYCNIALTDMTQSQMSKNIFAEVSPNFNHL